MHFLITNKGFYTINVLNEEILQEYYLVI